jgi:hypothetical protein
MDDPSSRIPDAIEPIGAYRAWFYSIQGRTARLHPLSAPIQSGNGWEGAGSTWVTATCPLFGSTDHEVPEEGCSCGFYSLKALDFAVARTGMLHLMARHRGGQGIWHDPVVLGRVLLSGKVIEHDFGYRAERARIAELIPFRGTERSVMVLADRLGVGMAPAVDPDPRDEAHLRPLLGTVALSPAHALAPRKVPTPPPSDPLTGPVAGVLAIVALIVSSLLTLAGVGQPPLLVAFWSLLQVGRSADSLSKMRRDLRDRLRRGHDRPRSLRLVPPPAP